MSNLEKAAGESQHLYEGKPDARQSSDQGEKVSRFRPKYRALNDAEKSLHDAIKDKASELESLFAQIPAGEYMPHAIKALEESVMWAVKDLTANRAE